MEILEFYLSQPRYLKQVGDSEPKYVSASPRHPVKVKLPRFIERDGEKVDQPEDAHLKRVHQPLKDASKPVQKPRVVPKNTARKLKPDDAGEAGGEAPAEGTRAADQ
jgi:hypothetical protein